MSHKKHISIEEFINNLKSVPSGIKYLEFVNNPENHISSKEKGENHHIYMRAICGDNNITVRLSYFNHIMAHIYLIKAGIEGNFWWVYKAEKTISQFTRKQIKYLSDIENITLNDIDEWVNRKQLVSEASSKANKERYKDPNERKKTGDKSRDRIWMNNGVDKTMVRPEDVDTFRNLGWEFGRITVVKSALNRIHMNDGTKNKLVKIEDIDKCRSMGWEFGWISNKKYMNNGTEGIYVDEKDIEYYEKQGFKLGKLNETRNAKNTKWMNNGDIDRMIKQEEIEQYKNLGWKFGRLKLNGAGDKKSASSKGMIFMTKEGERIYQVVPAKQNEFISNGYYRCMGRKNRESYKVTITVKNNILMTDGNCKPKRIKIEKVSEYEAIGWYWCDRNGNKKVA